MTYEECKKKLLRRYPDSIVAGSYSIPSGYLFSLKPKSWGDDEYVLGGLFKVSFDSKRIDEYSPVMDPEEFKLALLNPIE